MNKIEQRLAEALLGNEIVALRFAAAQERKSEVAHAEMRRLARQVLAESKMETKSGHEQAIRALRQVVREGYESLSEQQLADLREFFALTAEATVVVANGSMAVDLFKRPNRLPANVDSIIIDGTPAGEWWSRQADSVQRAFAREIRAGFVSGQTTDEIARRIVGRRGEPGILDVSLRQARSLAHTSVMAVANEAVEEVFQANSDLMNGEIWLSTLDSRTCSYCGPRDQLRYTLDHRPYGHSLPWDSGPGSAHINCRCTRTAWLKSWRELGLDIDDFEPTTRASADGPVSAGLTFEKWIEAKPAIVQREWFGPGRYEMYREGKITLRDLTDMRGRELTLSQLRERYG